MTHILIKSTHMHTLAIILALGTTIPAHHSVGVSAFRMMPNCSMQRNSCSICDFSGRGIL